MRHQLCLLLPFVLAAVRSLASGIQSVGKSEERSMILVETEYEGLLMAVFCLTGLLITISLNVRFPDLGAVIAEYNRF